MWYPSLPVASMFLSLNITIIMMLILVAGIWVHYEPTISAMLLALVLGCFCIMFRIGIAVDYYQVIYILEGEHIATFTAE